MQNILSLASFKKQLEEHQRVALLLFDSEDESSRCAFRNVSEATYLSEAAPVFVVDIKEVPDIQSHYELTEIPTLLFFIKGKLVEQVKGCRESDFVKDLIGHEFALQ